MILHTITPTEHRIEFDKPQFDIREVYDTAHKLLPGVDIMLVELVASTIWQVLTFEPYYPEVLYAT